MREERRECFLKRKLKCQRCNKNLEGRVQEKSRHKAERMNTVPGKPGYHSKFLPATDHRGKSAPVALLLLWRNMYSS